MVTDKIIQRLDSLIVKGQEVLATRRSGSSPGVIAPDYLDSALFHQWHTSALAFLGVVLGQNSVHYREFESRCKSAFPSDANQGIGILRAAKDDIEGGYLQKVEALISAEVFSDFLEMAEHLLDNGYKDPAASLVCAVLEDGLRRICVNNSLTVKSDDNISSLNKKLADRGIYNRLQQREIETWNKLRDYADHGHFKEYNAEKVASVLEGVRNFLASQLV